MIDFFATTEYFKEKISKHSFFTFLSAFLYIFIIVISFYIYFLSLPPKSFPKTPFLFTVSSGDTIEKVSKKLEEKKLIKSATLFKFWFKFKYDSVKAGDYLFKNKENIWKISSRLAHGSFGLEPVKVLIKEGATRKEIAKILEGKLMRFNKEKFLILSKDLEGFLFPDTYYFLPNASEEKAIKVMTDNFYKKISPLKKEIEKSGLSIKELITLASIVEREASKYKDRQKIAGVLKRRLKIGMPLQVDATWFYTHNKGTFGITLKELKDKDNPYNTYVHKGLPPTPIGSPSLSAIKATLYSVDTGALFYLSDKKGNTYFSKTYKEHLIKKQKYLK